MKLKSAFLALAVAGFATATTAETVRVGIATEAYPPFSTPDASGAYTGWEIDIINAICEEAALDCEIIATSWDGIIPSLTSDKIDVIAASLSINEERMQVIDFSDKYYQTGASIATATASGVTPTPEGVAGRNIGVQSGSIHQAYALTHFPDANIREYQTQDEANQDLFAGRIDGTLADVLVLAEFLNSDEGQLCCEDAGLVATDLEIHGQGVGFGIRQGSDELKATLNTAIQGIRSNGVYDDITARYFDFNIYGE
ncbi:transporter substrate-binding domain-containing protein [Cochlodiniinecator piscidefendens]|uniref:transporter substrate-binding domain-containing protein n=1 Tax=Cochlodiniinecator piscidefendens TaxID=2715756 RepID=UPI00197C6063|nr:transporter substrate-binding domain-containing protein [Cochlodiniinecator piscidefendens]